MSVGRARLSFKIKDVLDRFLKGMGKAREKDLLFGNADL